MPNKKEINATKSDVIDKSREGYRGTSFIEMKIEDENDYIMQIIDVEEAVRECISDGSIDVYTGRQLLEGLAFIRAEYTCEKRKLRSMESIIKGGKIQTNAAGIVGKNEAKIIKSYLKEVDEADKACRQKKSIIKKRKDQRGQRVGEYVEKVASYIRGDVLPNRGQYKTKLKRDGGHWYFYNQNGKTI